MMAGKHLFALYVPDVIKSVNSVVHIEDPTIYHRIMRVLKIELKDIVILFNKEVHAEAELIGVDKKRCTFLIHTVTHSKQIEPSITVGLPLLKGGDLDDAIALATQYGASAIQLLKTQYSQRTILQNDFKRFERIITAVTEQSKQFCMPVVHKPIPLDTVCSVYKDAHILVGSPTGKSIKTVLPDMTTKNSVQYLFLVGPEADFSEVEINMLSEWGVDFVSLGPVVLRSCTAGPLGVGILRILLT